jgi:hypothetical protein
LFRKIAFLSVLFGLLAFTFSAFAAEAPTRITILFDAFGKSPTLEQDWGFAALVEHDGKRILFDTGNSAEKFTANVRKLKVDLKRLDFVVISHRHGDHTDGLRHLLKVNPKVKIYVPDDEYFGGPTPPAFFRRPEPSLPAGMRYFNGAVPKEIAHGTPWENANLIRVDSAVDPRFSPCEGEAGAARRRRASPRDDTRSRGRPLGTRAAGRVESGGDRAGTLHGGVRSPPCGRPSGPNTSTPEWAV